MSVFSSFLCRMLSGCESLDADDVSSAWLLSVQWGSYP